MKIEEEVIKGLRELPNITYVKYKDNHIVIKSVKGKNNLSIVIDYLRNNNVQVGKIYSEPPTLNDVFLEITGKKLRD